MGNVEHFADHRPPDDVTDAALPSDPHALYSRFCEHPARDSEAFATLVKTHGQWLIDFLSRKTNDVHIAEDLAQEVWRKLFEKHALFDQSRDFMKWLKSMATHTYQDWKKHSQGGCWQVSKKELPQEGEICDGRPPLSVLIDPRASDAVTIAMRRELRQQILRSYSEIPGGQALAVEQRFQCGAKLGTLAEMLGVSTPTAYRLAERGRAAMHQRLSAKGVGMDVF